MYVSVFHVYLALTSLPRQVVCYTCRTIRNSILCSCTYLLIDVCTYMTHKSDLRPTQDVEMVQQYLLTLYMAG